MNDNAQAMVLGSFVGDALSLGVHWIYNTRVIDKKWGRVENYIKPQRPTYHPTKDLGELTHYGDQTLVLLQSVAACGGFERDDFFGKWQQLFKSYDGYLDKATTATLENLAAGKGAAAAGSQSDDLAGAARIAPLVYCYRHDPDKLWAAARAQTALTHNNPEVIASAEFFAKIAWRVLQGAAPSAALKQALDDGFDHPPYAKWVEDGLASVAQDTRPAVLDFGQMCEVEAAFPAVIHLIAKYEDDLKQGLIENAMAGGDSAGRGLLVGMILGARQGLAAIPPRWLAELKAQRQIVELMERIDHSLR